MDKNQQYKRNYDYQRNYLKRISVWFNTKNESDMEILDWLNRYYDGMSKSEGVKTCIWKCMKADQDKLRQFKQERQLASKSKEKN